jgi:hypothetical protein
MKRESFTAPFWIMLTIGIICSFYYYEVGRIGFRIGHWSATVILFLFLWPTLFCSESVIYWIIRKKIVNPKAAWKHLLFTGLGFIALPLIRGLTVIILTRSLSLRAMNDLRRTVYNLFFLIFWACLIAGQAFFVAVLVKSFSKKQAISADTSESVNLLDDIES